MKKPVRKAGAMGPGAMEKIGAKQGAAKRLREQPLQDKLRGVPSEDGFFAHSIFNPTKNQRRQDAARKLEKETGPLFAKTERDRKAGYRLADASKMRAKNMAKLKK
jgi:hypothetical protein